MLFVPCNGEHQGDFTIVSDSLANITLFYKGEGACVVSAYEDLWIELFGLIRSKSIALELEFVPSHLDEHPEKLLNLSAVPSDLSVASNMVADILAGYAAKKISVPPSISAPIIYYHCLVIIIYGYYS